MSGSLVQIDRKHQQNSGLVVAVIFIISCGWSRIIGLRDEQFWGAAMLMPMPVPPCYWLLFNPSIPYLRWECGRIRAFIIYFVFLICGMVWSAFCYVRSFTAKIRFLILCLTFCLLLGEAVWRRQVATRILVELDCQSECPPFWVLQHSQEKPSLTAVFIQRNPVMKAIFLIFFFLPLFSPLYFLVGWNAYIRFWQYLVCFFFFLFENFEMLCLYELELWPHTPSN